MRKRSVSLSVQFPAGRTFSETDPAGQVRLAELLMSVRSL
jgi:hypothetical protein